MVEVMYNPKGPFKAPEGVVIDQDVRERIIKKLTMLYDGNRNWSEYGHNYMRKLFYDYIFHQISVPETPIIEDCISLSKHEIEESIATLTQSEEQSKEVNGVTQRNGENSNQATNTARPKMKGDNAAKL